MISNTVKSFIFVGLKFCGFRPKSYSLTFNFVDF